MPVRKAGLYCINKGFKNSVFNSNREIYPDFFIKNPLYLTMETAPSI
jgi:hypothetical protein